jgi:class 3 adenylate cyclase
LAAHRGTEVKSLGDGFTSPAAVRCAVAIQRAMADTMVDGPALAVRVGVHAGEPAWVNRDRRARPAGSPAALLETPDLRTLVARLAAEG